MQISTAQKQQGKLNPFSSFWSNTILTLYPLWVAEADLIISPLTPP